MRPTGDHEGAVLGSQDRWIGRLLRRDRRDHALRQLNRLGGEWVLLGRPAHHRLHVFDGVSIPLASPFQRPLLERRDQLAGSERLLGLCPVRAARSFL